MHKYYMYTQKKKKKHIQPKWEQIWSLIDSSFNRINKFISINWFDFLMCLVNIHRIVSFFFVQLYSSLSVGIFLFFWIPYNSSQAIQESFFFFFFFFGFFNSIMVSEPSLGFWGYCSFIASLSQLSLLNFVGLSQLPIQSKMFITSEK